MYTSELFQEITESILLSPSAEYSLKQLLKSLDGIKLDNDLYEESEE